jgi:hypothetical protein
MMPIFRTEFSKFPLRGLGHTYKTGFNFRHLGNLGFTALVIVPIFMEFAVPDSSAVVSLQY